MVCLFFRVIKTNFIEKKVIFTLTILISLNFALLIRVSVEWILFL